MFILSCQSTVDSEIILYKFKLLPSPLRRRPLYRGISWGSIRLLLTIDRLFSACRASCSSCFNFFLSACLCSCACWFLVFFLWASVALLPSSTAFLFAALVAEVAVAWSRLSNFARFDLVGVRTNKDAAGLGDWGRLVAAAVAAVAAVAAAVIRLIEIYAYWNIFIENI